MRKTKKSRTPPARPLDMRTIAEGLTPEPKLWVSYGVVTPGERDDDIVMFDEEEGMPLVRVLLEPSKIPVTARVGMQTAGAGEGEWTPFLKGDELLVVIPDGEPRNGAVIVGRLNNQLDRFPFESVAGQDPKANNFAFQRRRTPYIQEVAGPWIVRSAITGALISLDHTGVVTVRDGEGAALQLSPDTVSLQGPSSPQSPPRFLLQSDLAGQRFIIQQGDALFALAASGASDGGKSYLTSPGALTLTVGPNAPIEHVATVEFVLACLGLMARLITPLGGGDPSTGGVITTGLAAVITAGGAPLDPAYIAALQAGLPIAALIPKLPVPNGVQALPGLGAVNFFTG